MFPNWNGTGPTSDNATAWPHSTSAHITLSSLMWSNHSNAAYVDERDEVMMNYMREFQASLDSPPIYDYPNYLYVLPISRTSFNSNYIVIFQGSVQQSCRGLGGG